MNSFLNKSYSPQLVGAGTKPLKRLLFETECLEKTRLEGFVPAYGGNKTLISDCMDGH